MRQGHQREVGQFGQSNRRAYGYSTEWVPARQYDVKYFTAHPLCLNKIGHVIHVSGAQIGGAVANVLQHSAVNAFTQDDFNAGPRGSIFGSDCGNQSVCNRHNTGDDDLASLFLANLAHAADTDAQVIQHALRDGYKFLARCSDRNTPCAAIEQPDSKNILDAHDRSGQSRLRGFQECGCSDKAIVLRDSENRMQLARTQIGNASRLHVYLYQKWN